MSSALGVSGTGSPPFRRTLSSRFEAKMSELIESRAREVMTGNTNSKWENLPTQPIISEGERGNA